ncbi:hypothetical protein BDN70DRAFT_816205, partial [Pholiota conissans]
EGYGTEFTRFMVDYASQTLNAHQVSLDVFGENERAAGLCRKMWARQRKTRWTNRKWEDTTLISISRDEWTKMREGTSE